MAVAALSSNFAFARQACRYARHRILPRKTYSDDHEDELIWKLLGGVRTFIDVGANDGVSCSNTVLAALRGAQGLCFEPNPSVFGKLQSFYRWAARVECVQEGISDFRGNLELRCDGLLSAMVSTEDAALSRLLSQYQNRDAEIISVPVRRLDYWLARRPMLAGYDLISIDVEGHELSVLRGIDWDRCAKPARAFVIETHSVNAEGLEWRHRDMDAINALLELQKYVAVATTRNNSVWVHEGELRQDRIDGARDAFPRHSWLLP